MMVGSGLLVFLACCSLLASLQGLSARQYSPIFRLRTQLVKKRIRQDMGFTVTNIKITDSFEANLKCPPWAECNSNECICRKELQKYSNTIKCNNVTLQLSVGICNCVTYDDSTGEVVMGRCLENCFKPRYNKMYLSLPSNASELNQFMCEERWNRTGRLCGKCLPGHSPLAYSYDMRCVKCPEGNRNVWKYILVAFGPLTIFYFLFLLLKINATSSHLHGYLLFAQIVSSPVFLRSVITSLNNVPYTTKLGFEIVGALYGIWNLDFFRGLYPDICLDVSTLTILALDYAVAIYPLLLTVVSYFLIELHARNVRVVVILWKPFGYFFELFRKNWDSKTTIIDAFTTFFVLSFSKIVWTSFDLLSPVTIYSLSSNTTSRAFFFNATVSYFSKNHLPYAVLALVFCLIFIIIPLILLLCYQVKLIQRMLSCLNVKSHLLQAVMDSIQGHYKDGTEEGTRDRRWFAAVPLIGRFAIFLCHIMMQDTQTFVIPGIAILVSMAVLTALVQPYKNRFARYSKIDIFFWGLLAVQFCSLQVYFCGQKLQAHVSSIFTFVLMVFAIVYMICVTAYWILSRMRKVKALISQVKAWWRGYVNLETDFEAILPDRVINPDKYCDKNVQDPMEDNQTDGDKDTY